MRYNRHLNQLLSLAVRMCGGLAPGLLIWTSLHTAITYGATPPTHDSAVDKSAATDDAHRLMRLGPGDSVSIQVYGQPEMNGTVYVGEDGAISLPLVGRVQVTGLSAVGAGEQVEKALAKGQLLVDPHVTVTIVQSRTQRVIVLGEVHTPGRYTVEPNANVIDILAQAGGVTENASDVVYVSRADAKGVINRYAVDLLGFSGAKDNSSSQILQGGDSVFVPRAGQYYIYGEVATPNMYKLTPNMSVIQAIARAGGITAKGSERRLEIKRTDKDGHYLVIRAKPDDLVRADDVIRVKESIF